MPSVRCCFVRMRMNRESEALGFCILTACRLPELRFRRLLGVLTDARSYLRKAVTFPPGGCRPSIFQFAQSGLFIVARRAIVSGVGVGLAHLGKVTPTSAPPPVSEALPVVLRPFVLRRVIRAYVTAGLCLDWPLIYRIRVSVCFPMAGWNCRRSSTD